MGLDDLIIEPFLAWSQKTLKDKFQEKMLRDEAAAYLQRKQKENGLYSLNNEYDYEGLCKYISDLFPKRFDEYVNTPGEKRQLKRQTIHTEALSFALPKGNVAGDQVSRIVDAVFDLYAWAYRQSVPSGERLLLGNVEASVVNGVDDILKAVEDVKEAVTAHENSSASRFRNYGFDIENHLRNQKECVLNYSIFPWFSGSKRYSELFPTLFITPKIKDRGNDVTYGALLNEKEHHIAVLGEAGAGKSTLLRYLFLFETFEGIRCIYLTAKEVLKKPSLLKKINNASSEIKTLVLLDGLDEAFHNRPQQYADFIGDLKSYDNCRFWIGCRIDFYKQYYSEATNFTRFDMEIQPWDEDQADPFIRTYAKIVQKPFLEETVRALIGDSAAVRQMKTNPFQLSLLVFLAENNENDPILCVYDLYEKFVGRWYKREHERGTTLGTYGTVLNSLRKAANNIYNGKAWKLDSVALSNTAVKNLLYTEEQANGDIYAAAFYHRSLAAFIIAQQVFQAFESGDFISAKKMLSTKLLDDITNFIGAKVGTLSIPDKIKLKNNLIEMYGKSSHSSLSVREQLIYFVSRLGIDVSDFLKEIISNDPPEPIMRLTLAYGCILSDDPVLRNYALDYAKSIASGSNDAKTNRGWTVVYFGDVLDRDPYTYLDDEKRGWSKARAARIKRFTRKNPRLKDVRFWLFDIPLFRSFLEDRNWDNLSQQELTTLKSLTITEQYFNQQEIEFLTSEHSLLVQGYEERLLR